MSARLLVVAASAVVLCAAQVAKQQSSPQSGTPVANSPNGETSPAAGGPSPSAPPAVTIGPDQVRPADNAADGTANEKTSASAPPAAAPAATVPQPIPNPNSPAHPQPGAGSAPSGPFSPEHPYVVGTLDVLEIRVWNDAKLTGLYTIRPDGLLSLPLIGEFKADGYTVPDLTKVVAAKLTKVMNDPEVNIQVAKINSKRVFVFGGVLHPGEMPLYQNMTVLDALSNVGFKDFANTKKITIMRGTQMFHFNYKETSKGRHMDQNIELQNGDRIFVPE